MSIGFGVGKVATVQANDELFGSLLTDALVHRSYLIFHCSTFDIIHYVMAPVGSLLYDMTNINIIAA